MAANPVLAPALPGWEDIEVIPDRLIERLHQAGEGAVAELTASLSPEQRANVAVYCYRRSHLHRIGLAIAASCDHLALTRVLGTSLGSALFLQARESAHAQQTPTTSHRPKVTLAKSTALRSVSVSAPEQSGAFDEAADDGREVG